MKTLLLLMVVIGFTTQLFAAPADKHAGRKTASVPSSEHGAPVGHPKVKGQPQLSPEAVTPSESLNEAGKGSEKFVRRGPAVLDSIDEMAALDAEKAEGAARDVQSLNEMVGRAPRGESPALESPFLYRPKSE